jgi:hypothetical protein
MGPTSLSDPETPPGKGARRAEVPVQVEPEDQALLTRFVNEAHVLSDGRWAPIPRWAEYLVRLGAECATLPGAPGSTLALVLPTRAYASMFCALGIVLRRASVAVPTDVDAHYSRLRELPRGTPVTFRTKTAVSRFPGWLMGSESISGVDFLIIQPSKGSTTIKVSRAYALDVIPTDRVMAELPDHPVCKAVRGYGPLLGTLAPVRLAWQFLVASRLECVIVGSEATIRQEIMSSRFSLPAAGPGIEGSAQELLRVRRFITGDGAHKSDVFSGTGSRQAEARAAEPAVAIFDGAKSLLRWGTLWQAASRIVLLERTDSRLADAAEEIDRLFFQQRAIAPDALQGTPPGVEGIRFGGVA